MVDKARIGVIGTGWWSTYAHIPALRAHPAAQLVAICDSDPERLRAAATTYDIHHTYDDYRQMIATEDLQGVVVATNHASHYAIARACLEHKLHVVLEKPMTLFAPDARHLVDLAREQERALIIGYPYHYMPQVRRARQVIQSGALGTIQLVTCVFSSRVIEFLRGELPPDEDGTTFPVHGPGTVYS